MFHSDDDHDRRSEARYDDDPRTEPDSEEVKATGYHGTGWENEPDA